MRSVLFYSYVLLLADTIHILKEVGDSKDYNCIKAEIVFNVTPKIKISFIGKEALGKAKGGNSRYQKRPRRLISSIDSFMKCFLKVLR